MVYSFLMSVVDRVLPIAALFSPDIHEAILVRQNQRELLEERCALRPADVPLYLFHASSAGEYQQAIPVIRELKKRHPDAWFVMSFFSVSASKIAVDDAITFTCYLPFDTQRNARHFFDTLRPTVFIVTAYDFWLNHQREAYVRNIPQYLIAGILKADSSRLKFPLSFITSHSIGFFDAVFTVSLQDLQSMQSFAHVRNGCVLGDPRFDHIIEKSHEAESHLQELPLPDWRDKTVLTLGSVWEPGWESLSPFLAEFLANDSLRIFAVPHNLKNGLCEGILADCAAADISAVRYSDCVHGLVDASVRVILVDTVGILSALYARTTIAYVGGGFGKGVHNVAEPAVFGVPVVMGPSISHSLEARTLRERGGAIVCDSAEEIPQELRRLISSPEEIQKMREITMAFMQESAGAACRTADQLEAALVRDRA